MFSSKNCEYQVYPRLNEFFDKMSKMLPQVTVFFFFLNSYLVRCHLHKYALGTKSLKIFGTELELAYQYSFWKKHLHICINSQVACICLDKRKTYYDGRKLKYKMILSYLTYSSSVLKIITYSFLLEVVQRHYHCSTFLWYWMYQTQIKLQMYSILYQI